MKNIKTTDCRVGYFLVFLFLLASPPLVFELFPFMPNWKVLYVLIFPVLFVYSLRFNPFKGINKELLCYWIIAWTLFAVLHGDSVYISRVMVAVISIFTLGIIRGIGIDRFGDIYTRIILVFAILGTLVFFLVFLIDFSPIFEYENADGKPGYCFGVTCTNSYTPSLRNVRYSGFFDEPGAMGLWGSMALLINKLTRDNKKIEILLMICLCFTFSMGFFLTLFLYVLFFSLKNKSKILLIFLAVIIGIGAYYLIQTNENIYRMTIARLEYDSSTGSFAGDNRYDQKYVAIEYFIKNPIIGVGATETNNLAEKGYNLGDNIMSPLAKDGILGVLVIYLPLLLSFYKYKKDRTALKCLIIFTATFFHRSIVFTVFNIVMYLLFLDIIKIHYLRTRPCIKGDSC